MKRSETRILTTHTGSLPRPRELTRLYARRVRGEAVDDKTIEAAGLAALKGIVPQQIACGLDIINNGEQQRESFVLYLRHRLTGLGEESHRGTWKDLKSYPDYQLALKESAPAEAVTHTSHLPAAIGAITYSNPGAVDAECDDFANALKGQEGRYAEAFMTAPSPGIIGSIVENRHYDSEQNYLAALGRALAIEYRAIVKHGFLLQLDCPDLALERHGLYQDRPLSDFLGFCERVVGTINDALDGIPRDRVRLHVCWGNYEGPHDADVPLADILPVVMKARVGGFVLPFANPRHAHEYRVFSTTKLADDQILVAGVIDTTTNFIEHPETIADRIERVAQVIGDPTRVQAGTDCGFDTSAGRGRVAADVAWAKIRAMREGADLASKRLFRG